MAIVHRPSSIFAAMFCPTLEAPPFGNSRSLVAYRKIFRHAVAVALRAVACMSPCGAKFLQAPPALT